MATETEIKLLAQPDVLPKVAGLAAVRACKEGRARTEQLYSRYYDTPQGALARAGMALRVRRSGNRWIQAVKTAGSSAAGLHSRGEWESEVEGDAPDLAALKSTPAYAVLRGARGFRLLT